MKILDTFEPAFFNKKIIDEKFTANLDIDLNCKRAIFQDYNKNEFFYEKGLIRSFKSNIPKPTELTLV